MKIYVASGLGSHKGARFLTDEVRAILDAHLPGWTDYQILLDGGAIVDGSETVAIDTGALVAALEADPLVAQRIEKVALDAGARTQLFAEAEYISLEHGLADLLKRVRDLEAEVAALKAS